VLSVGLIVVDPAGIRREISPLVFGLGVEWVENGNRLLDPASGRLRAELIAKLKPLRVPVWRFPGGILADHYHWRDGVGPRHSRPLGANPMDGSSHANAFGTEEFIELCRSLGSEGLVTLNFGNGTLEEALAWQKHFISKGFPVRYWEVGNEIYLAEPRAKASIPGNDRRIFHTAQKYAGDFPRWSAALKAQDPSCLVGAIVGTSNTSRENADWSKTLARACPSGLDFVAVHNGFAPLIVTPYDYRNESARMTAYRAMLAQPIQAAEDTRAVRREFAACGTAPRIAVTEHFPLFGAGDGDQIRSVLDQSRTLAAALYTASLLHSFIREDVFMANYNIAVSKWFGALVTDSDSGLILTPTYHVYDLYRNHFGTTVVPSQVEGPSYSTGALGTVAARSGVDYLDVLATQGTEGLSYLAVINRHLTQPVQARLSLGAVPGPIDVLTLGGVSPNTVNGTSLTPTTKSGGAEDVKPRSSRWTPGGDGPFEFPRSSLTILRWRRT
jgi:alpha-N-arabinofuranosidase